MLEIKPCPFCGSTEIEYEPTYTGGGESHGVMVCLQCGCTVPTSEFGKRVKEPYSEWNRRYGECDRDALLDMEDEMFESATGLALISELEDDADLKDLQTTMAKVLFGYARRIREAIGEDAS